MTPGLIFFSIRSIARLAHVGNDAVEQWARDARAVFPVISQSQISRETQVTNFFDWSPERRKLVQGPQARFGQGKYWEVTQPIRDPNAVDALYAAMIQVTAEEAATSDAAPNQVQAGAAGTASVQAGAIMVGQWGDGKGSVSPWARVVLTAADIALEYVSINPDLIGGNGNGSGDKILKAYAQNLADLLPDNGQFGVKDGFAEHGNSTEIARK